MALVSRRSPFAGNPLKALARRLAGTLTFVRTEEPLAALTFDDGPHPEETPRVLEVLARHGARATFFMVGSRAAAHPELVAQVAAAGHAIGNHTYDHLPMPETPRLERLRQLARTRRALGRHDGRLFRPPFGGQSYGSRADALLLGYEVVAWTMHGEDWAGHDSATILGRLERQLRPGAIVLLHDTLFTAGPPEVTDRGPLLTALDAFLAHHTGDYQFLTVPELMRRGEPVRTPWFRPALRSER